MSQEPVRFRAKLGAAEFEFEGGRETLREDVMPTINRLVDMLETQAGALFSTPAIAINDTKHAALPAADTGRMDSNSQSLTTSTIATILSAKSGSDLAESAAANLTFTQGKQSFSQEELLNEMKSASAFYKQSDGKNLGRSIKGLVKAQRFHAVSGGNYSLPHKVREELEQKLAQHQ